MKFCKSTSHFDTALVNSNRQQYLYFSDIGGGNIERMEFNGTIPEAIVDVPFQSIGQYEKPATYLLLL